MSVQAGPRSARTMSAAWRPYTAHLSAGYRRWSTYRLATAAGAFTNTIFGLIKAAVMVATVGAAGGTLAGYDATQAATFAWVTQALFASVNIFGRDDLAQRVRTGDVAVDLARPIDPLLAAWASDLGRAIYQLLPRGLPPLLVGLLVTGLTLPGDVLPYLLFPLSLALGVSISFVCVWLVNLSSFWLLDVRGPMLLYAVVAGLLSGLTLPLAWFPGWLATLAHATPFPSILQAPVDVLTGRVVGFGALQVLVTQVAWLVVVVVVARVLWPLATRKLVVQGG